MVKPFAAEPVSQAIRAQTGLDADSWITTNAQFFSAIAAQSMSNLVIRFCVGLTAAPTLRLEAIRKSCGAGRSARVEVLPGIDLTLARGKRVASRIDTGMAFVYHPGWTTPDLPFGGIKNSGSGREISSLGIQEFVGQKLVRVESIDARA